MTGVTTQFTDRPGARGTSESRGAIGAARITHDRGTVPRGVDAPPPTHPLC